ncbi:hypothetical protein OS493_030063 [Desmophyllum pertusum]|uniref:Uncharacterized protein n=1 Tax=Desmophyllum pertusum TaxID=174260 RepID=A0A9W9Z8X7_9CNID|nr:hypothetical protein OS493_030063 [Desmophyllum pertusum]
MPRTVVSDFNNMSVKGTNLFHPRNPEKDRQIRSVSGDEVSTQTEVKVDKRSLKLPALAKTRRLNQDENNDLQVLLRIRCFDFSLQVQGLKPEVKESSKKSSSCSAGSQSVEDSTDQNDHKEIKEDGRKSTNKESSKHKEFVPSLSSSTVLEGQRVNLKEKYELNNQTKELHCQPTDKENQPSYPNDTRSENFHIEKMIRSKIISLNRRKQDVRPLFPLPKVDKYDIMPGNIINGKVCTVFKLNDLKSSSIYSDYKDSWIPNRERYYTNNSVFFNALLQQPTVLLRQPSPVAGVKMTLKEHEDSLVAEIYVAKETNTCPAPVDAEVTREVKKIVIKLPPIC